MTIEELSRAMEQQSIVTYRGSEYLVTGVITRNGRQPNMTTAVPDGWWYQIELTDLSTEGAVVIANMEDVNTKQE